MRIVGTSEDAIKRVLGVGRSHVSIEASLEHAASSEPSAKGLIPVDDRHKATSLHRTHGSFTTL